MLIRVGRSMGTSLLVAICKFAALPVLAHAMQPVDFGVYALITSMLSFGLLSLDWASATTRSEWSPGGRSRKRCG